MAESYHIGYLYKLDEIIPECYLDLLGPTLIIAGSSYAFHLQPMEYDCLSYLATKAGWLCTYSDILTFLENERGYNFVSTKEEDDDKGKTAEQPIRDAFYRINKKIRKVAKEKGKIDIPQKKPCQNIAGEGYKLGAKRLPRFNYKTKILSTLVAPVSGQKFVTRPWLDAKMNNGFHNSRFVFLCAMSGSGKSEQARHYIANTSYRTVIKMELDSDGSGSFEEMLDKQINLNNDAEAEDQLKEKKRMISQLDLTSIILLDNLNDYDNAQSILADLNTKTGKSKILITSQLSESLLQEICEDKALSSSIISLDNSSEKYSDDFVKFPSAVFCSFAGMDLEELPEKDRAAIQSICQQTGNHAMIVAALGQRIKKGDKLAWMLEDLKKSVKECLAQEVRVKIKKDQDLVNLTPYDILKRLFKNVLMKPFTETQRQVIGALIMLPPNYHKKSIIAELVGDLPGFRTYADSAIQNLHEDGIVYISEDVLYLHDLYKQLFTDDKICFADEDGQIRTGPIAELSMAFAIHLLNNRFVSTTMLQGGDTLQTYRQMYAHMFPYVNNPDIPDQYKGWISVFEECFDSHRVEHIRTAITLSHTQLHMDNDISSRDLEVLFCDTFYDDWLDPSDEQWIQSFLEECADLPITNRISLPKTETVMFEPSWKPEHPGLFVSADSPTGRSLWVVDYVTKQEFCILNLLNQRCQDCRYFKKTAINNVDSPKYDAMEKASLLGFLGGFYPEYLLVPSHIAGNVPIQSISDLDIHFSLASSICKMVCIPETVKTIGRDAFLGLETLRYIVVLGDGVSIANSAFDAVAPASLEIILLPDVVTKIGNQSFGHLSLVKRIVIPHGAILTICFPDYGLYAASREINGKVCLIMQAADGTEHYYHIEQILSSLNSVLSGLPVLYDISGNQLLDWDMLLEKIEGGSLTTGIKLRIGIDFTIDNAGEICFSEHIQATIPWLRHNPSGYVSSVPKGCQIYIRNNSIIENGNAESENINQLYVDDIASIITHCITEADIYRNRGEIHTANTMIQIVLQLLTAKEKVLPAAYCQEIRDRLSFIPNSLANNP